MRKTTCAIDSRHILIIYYLTELLQEKEASELEDIALRRRAQLDKLTILS